MPYYAVANGRKPGIYSSWPECEAQVKKFPGARFKKFLTLTEAQEFVNKFSVKESPQSKKRRREDSVGTSSGVKVEPADRPSPTKQEEPAYRPSPTKQEEPAYRPSPTKQEHIAREPQQDITPEPSTSGIKPENPFESIARAIEEHSKIDMKNTSSSKYIEEQAARLATRVEQFGKMVRECRTGQLHETIHIQDGAIGYGYVRLFGKCLTDDVTHITIEDAYIRSAQQCNNFLQLCELAVQRCNSLQFVSLVTTRDTNQVAQMNRLDAIKRSLARKGVVLTVNYSATLHDRSVKMSNGWIVKIGRGLDYFKRPEGDYSLGTFDLNLRECRETTVDIYHLNSVSVQDEDEDDYSLSNLTQF